MIINHSSKQLRESGSACKSVREDVRMIRVPELECSAVIGNISELQHCLMEKVWVQKSK